MTVTVVDAPLTDSDMGAEVLADGRIKFSFKQDGSTDTSSAAAGLGVGTMKLEITCPGKVVEASPEFEKDGNNSVSLSTALDKSVDVYAIGESSGGGSSSSSPIVPIVIAVGLALLIGYAAMRNRAAAKTTQVDPTGQTDPGQLAPAWRIIAAKLPGLASVQNGRGRTSRSVSLNGCGHHRYDGGRTSFKFRTGYHPCGDGELVKYIPGFMICPGLVCAGLVLG